jgi:hypothetical protein
MTAFGSPQLPLPLNPRFYHSSICTPTHCISGGDLVLGERKVRPRKEHGNV